MGACFGRIIKFWREAVGFTAENYVTSQQTHTTNVRRVAAAEQARVSDGARLYDVDGLITNEKHIPLVIFGADCVPVFLLDKKESMPSAWHTAAGLAQATAWRKKFCRR